MQPCRTGTRTRCVAWMRVSEGADVAVLKQAQQAHGKKGRSRGNRPASCPSVHGMRTPDCDFASVRSIERLPKLCASFVCDLLRCRCRRYWSKLTGAEKAGRRHRYRPASFPSVYELFGTCWRALVMQRCRMGTRTRCVAWKRASQGAGVAVLQQAQQARCKKGKSRGIARHRFRMSVACARTVTVFASVRGASLASC